MDDYYTKSEFDKKLAFINALIIEQNKKIYDLKKI